MAPATAKEAARKTPASPLRKTRAQRVRAMAWRWTKRLLLAATLLAALSALGIVLAVRHYEDDLPTIPDLKGNYHPPQVTRILARDGKLLAELFTERRTVISIQTLPAHVKLAVLAAEDANFYEHEGVNYLGIARALVVNFRAGRTKQGGSTITQQVVKNIILDPEKTYRRKIREALLARRLEQELTKDEILELYLNHIYFGHGRYGIQEAARDNFGKDAKDLTIAEAAFLAGIVAGPEAYSPRRDLTKTLVRRAYVLGQMHAKGFLNDAQYDAARTEAVHLAPLVEASSELAPEAVEIVRRTLHELDPERAKKGGFTVTTSIDPELQLAARKAVRENLLAYDKRHGLTGALKAPPMVASFEEKKKGHKPPPPKDKDPLFEGTPDFERHRVYVGAVTSVDDAGGTFDVRVGDAIGTVKLADYERYNPTKLTASEFAPMGSHLRVSLLAPLPELSEPTEDAGAPLPTLPVVAKVPLRMESGPEGSLIAVDVRTRQILALIGNYEAESGGLDRAMQVHRQPGSTFKPILYSYAIHSRRYTPATLIDVNPDGFEGGYRPSNYEGWKGTDPVRLREAIAHSINLVAVRVLRDVGPSNVVAWAQSLGIQSTMKPDLSLALGSYELRPVELVGAYATLASGGVYDEPRLITRIVGPDGKDVALKALPPPRRVLDDAEAYVTTSMLTSVIDHGTGTRAKELHRPVAGKTGTSNASKDTWFAGYSTDVAAVVWVGYDDGRPLGGAEAGGTTALPAWVAFMKAAHEGKPKGEFPRPAGLTTVTIDSKTGKLPYQDDADTMDEVFLVGTEPTDIAAVPELDAGAAIESDAGTTTATPFDASAPSAVRPVDAGLVVRATP